LGSDKQIERLSSAALLRRFFDAKSKYGMRNMPYALDAARLASAVLKTEPTGVVQKALADGLADSQDLAGGDFQRANLCSCFWGPREGKPPVDARSADFFHAYLSAASLRGAQLQNAIFYGAQLVGTVLAGADLRGCDFRSANLRGAQFAQAKLKGAKFSGARYVPLEITAQLDGEVKFTGDEVPQPGKAESAASAVRVFLSRPSDCDRESKSIVAQVNNAIADAGMELVTFPPGEYGIGAPLDEATQRISACDAVIILGVPQIRVKDGVWRPGTDDERKMAEATLATPWNHIEAGIAAALDKPILIIRDRVGEGVFEIGEQPQAVTVVDVGQSDGLTRLNESVTEWAHGLPRQVKRPETRVAGFSVTVVVGA
jgi:hypothetical protein